MPGSGPVLTPKGMENVSTCAEKPYRLGLLVIFGDREGRCREEEQEIMSAKIRDRSTKLKKLTGGARTG